MSKGRDFIDEADQNKKNSPAYLKVPGSLIPIGQMQHEQEKLKKEMKNMNLAELKDMLSRQQKLTDNARLVQRLPDKGLKVRLKLEVMKTLVSEKEGEDTLVSALARLHLPDTDAMEWKNKQHTHKYNEEEDPSLRVLAEGAVPGLAEGGVSRLAEGAVPRRSDQTSGIEYISRKVDVLDEFHTDQRFAPFCSTQFMKTQRSIPPPPTSDRLFEKRSPSVKTPSIPLPDTYHCTTKQLSIKESIVTQRIQNSKIREASLRQAAARLAGPAPLKAKNVDEPTPLKPVGGWRDQPSADSDDDHSDDDHAPPVILDSDNEVHDDEDDVEPRGIVVQTFEDQEE